MCCCCCCKSSGAARCWAIIAGIFTLCEAIAWFGLAIASLALYYCKIPVDPLPDMTQPPQEIAADAIGDFVYVVYYYNYECSKPLTSPDEGWKPGVPLYTAERTWQWSVAYIVVSGLWVIASLLLFGYGIIFCHGCSRRFFPGFWGLVCLTVLVMDVVSTIQYGLDIGAVMEETSLMALMGDAVTPSSQLEKFIKEIPVAVSVIPSVVLTLAASRCFILWAINLIFFFGVVITCRRAPIKKKDAEPLNPPYNTQVAPMKTHGAAPARQDEFMWRGGPQQNLSYIGYDEAYDRDPGPIPQRRSYLGDYDPNHADGRRNSRSSATPTELRNQMPWSYLQPDEPPPRPLSPVRHVRNRSPEPWDPSHSALPQAVMRLPRPNISPSAPSSYQQQNQQQQNPSLYYQYPFQQPNNPKQSGNNIYLRS